MQTAGRCAGNRPPPPHRRCRAGSIATGSPRRHARQTHPPSGGGPRQALIEANRCLFCFDAPCIQACPTGIDVPSFIRKIAAGNVVGASRTILSANILGASCARVCPTLVLCEGACVLDDREEHPIAIGRLQRHAIDQAAHAGARLLPTVAPSTGRRVAIVGAGPAGLGCASELAKLAHPLKSRNAYAG